MRLFSCGQKPWQDSALSLNTQDGCVAEFCRRSLKGMKDVPPSQFANRKYIVDAARHVSALYGYGEMETPLIEHADLFRRTLGASSDVVQKEMFEFVDKGGTSVVLRPEGTAGIARMFATRESDLVRQLPQRLFYAGPMFRYEQPQRGRQRQFFQARKMLETMAALSLPSCARGCKLTYSRYPFRFNRLGWS